MSQSSQSPAAPKESGEAKPRPERKNPAGEEKRVDQAVEDSFPASDPSSETQPKPTRGKK
jgi:hypothetical protein